MRKLLYTIIITLVSIPIAFAQQQYYDWHLGAGIGSMAYYGDLSYKINTTAISFPAYRFSIGRNISPSLALSLQGTFGQLYGNDRAKNWKGNLQPASPDFSRALNFKTVVRNGDLLLSYRFNNGYLLSEHAFIGPYVFAGVGLTDFTVYGDLFNSNGGRYYYWNDNTIRNMPQNQANANMAQIVEQDGKYETNLTQLNTENNYPTRVWSIPLGAGIKFRISERFSANLQAGAHYTFTGYLDDVKGPYPDDYTSNLQAYVANPSGIKRSSRGNGKNDMFFTAALSLNYHFNFKKKSFKAPMVYIDADPFEGIVEKPSKENSTEVTDVSLPVPPPVKSNLSAQTKSKSTKDIQAPGKRVDERNQQVDVNVRIFIEDGNESRDSRRISSRSNGTQAEEVDVRISRQGNLVERNFTSEDSINSINVQKFPPLKSVYNAAEINALQRELAQVKTELQQLKAQRKDVDADKDEEENDSTQQKTLPLVINRAREQAQENNPEMTALQERITALTTEVEQLRGEQTDTEKPLKEEETQTLKSRKDTSSDADRTDNDERGENAQKIDSLEKEIKSLQTEMEKQRNTNTQPQLMQPMPVDRQERIVLQMPPALLQNQYEPGEMKQLQQELSSLKKQIQTLEAQQKVDSQNIQITSKLDSLMELVDNIDRLQAASVPKNTTNSTDTVTPLAEQQQSQQNEVLMDSLRNEITSLNTALASMQNQLEEINSTPPVPSLVALGSSVVYYATNSAALNEADKRRLAILAKQLKLSPDIILHVKGFTDQVGDPTYNLLLSRKRAENVKRFFVEEMSVAPDQILINYYGQQQPQSGSQNKNNPTARRVELELFRE